MRHALNPLARSVPASLAALLAGTALIAAAPQPKTAAPAPAPVAATAPAPVIQLSTGRGRLVTLARPMSDLFVADDTIADVQVRSPTQLYVFGKKSGETTVSATARGGQVVFSTTVRVGDNFDSIGTMLQLAMPDAHVVATPMNGLVLLTGTVAAPEDAAEAERLVQGFVGDKTKVLSRLKTATPLQVNLQVRIVEVARSFAKNIGVNTTTRDTTGGFNFGVGSGRPPGTIAPTNLGSYPTADASSLYGLPAGSVTLPFNPATGQFINPVTATTNTFTKNPQSTTLGLAGKLLGLDVLSAIDLGETIGQVTTLANPNLTSLSGETATFLVGGEIPIPLSQGLGAVSVEYKQYGVSLAYTPTVLSDGRISLRVRPEVSELTAAGSVTIGGIVVPGLSTRRAETTVELGSGQSLMIGGLIQNVHNNQLDQAPGLANVPVLGALFRSNGWKRNETELVIVVTPYLVKPVNNLSDIALPTDGYKAPTDLGRIFMGQLGSGNSGEKRPVPTMAQPEGASPAIGAVAPVLPAPQPVPATPSKADARDTQPSREPKKGVPAPGFSN